MRRLFRLVRLAFVIIGLGIVGYGLSLSTSGSQGRWLGCLAGGGFLVAAGLWPRPDDSRDDPNRPVVNVVSTLAFVFALLAVQLARMQVLSGKAISQRSGIDPISGDSFSNIRDVNASLSGHRGSIVDRNGTVLAKSVKRRGVYDRDYPIDTASYVCGYFSPLRYGSEGLERVFDDELSGRRTGSPIEREVDQLLGHLPKGGSISLTIDAALQSKTHELLNDRTGAVVLIEIKTGAVVALASNPHFDPSKLVAVDFDSSESAAKYWQELTDDPTQPLLMRATNGLYTPGSTFKIITLAAAIETGTATPSDVYTDDGSLTVDGHTIVEENRPDDTIDRWTLEQGLAYSLNVVFAQVGLELGGERLSEYAERFGFGQQMPFDIPVATGQVSTTGDFLDRPSALADTAFGQGQLLTTPLGMALVAAAIANDGEMMRPFLVAEIVDTAGKLVASADQSVWRRPISSSTASIVRDQMVNTVVNGSSTQAAIDGLLVGGKTGTAETGQTEPHAWFIGFAGDPEPSHAVAVVLEHGGSAVSGPILIARQMLSAAIFGPGDR